MAARRGYDIVIPLLHLLGRQWAIPARKVPNHHQYFGRRPPFPSQYVTRRNTRRLDRIPP
jgi:hypothetical protein